MGEQTGAAVPVMSHNRTLGTISGLYVGFDSLAVSMITIGKLIWAK